MEEKIIEFLSYLVNEEKEKKIIETEPIIYEGQEWIFIPLYGRRRYFYKLLHGQARFKYIGPWNDFSSYKIVPKLNERFILIRQDCVEGDYTRFQYIFYLNNKWYSIWSEKKLNNIYEFISYIAGEFGFLIESYLIEGEIKALYGKIIKTPFGVVIFPWKKEVRIGFFRDMEKDYLLDIGDSLSPIKVFKF